jgi:hypothetical protein
MEAEKTSDTPALIQPGPCSLVFRRQSTILERKGKKEKPFAKNNAKNLQTHKASRLLTSSLSLGVPVPRPTQCMGGA